MTDAIDPPADRAPTITRSRVEGEDRLIADGDWTLPHVEQLAARIEALGPLDALEARLDASAVTRLDASGALMLERLTDALGLPSDERALPVRWRRVFDAVDASCDAKAAPEQAQEPA